MRKIEADFRQNALSSLLVLRLIPLFPFFVVNVVPALLGVRPGTYARGTVVGIIPGAFVCATVGAGWGSVFDRMEAVSLTGILTPEIIAALVGLAVLALLRRLQDDSRPSGLTRDLPRVGTGSTAGDASPDAGRSAQLPVT